MHQAARLCLRWELRAVTSEIDVYRSAHALIQQHGEAAAIQAAMRVDAMLEKGDMDGRAVLLRILTAVKELLDTRPRNGAALN